jgi:hypothetical protein
MTCHIGGLVDQRHAKIRDWLAGLIRRSIGPGSVVEVEKVVPKWHRVRNGIAEDAVLDITYAIGGRRVYVDVAVVTVMTADGCRRRARASRDGAAASAEEDDKRRRYPGPELRPFVLEAHGRLGDDAMAFLRELAPPDLADRSAFISGALQELSVILQTANAELLLQATG